MNPRRDVRVRVHKLGPEADDALFEESILHWRRLGPAAAWDAMFEVLDRWFLARGMDPEAQRVDRSHIEIHPVPWRTGADAETTETRFNATFSSLIPIFFWFFLCSSI